jgi:ABC-2 type transport system permease protein
MRGTLAIARREMRSAFESPVAYVTIGLFVLATAGLFFLAGMPVGRVTLPSLWEGGQASLIVLYAWLPLLLAVLVPALAMGAWAEERRAGTEELLLTYPLRTGQVVMGKFLALWVLIALLTTLTVVPVAVTVDRLGDLDWGTVGTGLIGVIALGGSYAAVALLLSASTQEQLVAFLLGALLLSGLWLLRLMLGVFPPDWAAALDYATPSAHFLDSAARGVVDLRDLVYFLCLGGAALYGNVLLVERRRWGG